MPYRQDSLLPCQICYSKTLLCDKVCSYIYPPFALSVYRISYSNKKVNSSAQVVAKPVATTTNESLYRVRKSWDNPKSQLGAYKTLDNAKKNCPGGYYVFDSNGKIVYPVVQNSTSVIPNKGKCTITVKEGIIFRDKPSVSVGIRQGVYNYKESVNYDSKMETDKYTWISWIGASTGTRRYMPVVDKTTGEKWGSFA